MSGEYRPAAAGVLRAGSYPATCRRDGSRWVVEVPRLGRRAPAARLGEIEDVARGLVADVAVDDLARGSVVVQMQVRQGLAELLSAAAAARREPDCMSVPAVTLRRDLARRLAGEGFDGHDVAALLGLSYGRAIQLVRESGHQARGSLRPRPTEPAAGAVAAPRAGADVGDRRPHSSYRHEAYFYRGIDELVSDTCAFVEDAVRLGQPVMVAVAGERLDLLRDGVAEADRVQWVDMAELGANPARIIAAWRRFLDEHAGAGGPVRGVGEPVWSGRRPVEISECQLHEALLNLAVEPDTPLWLRCPYDAASLHADVLTEATRSHPALVEADSYRGSQAYGGADHALTMFARDLPESPGTAPELLFDYCTLAAVRPAVLARAAETCLTPARRDELALAVTEAATNSVRHGGGRGGLRIWEQDGALVCEVRDCGHIDDPLVGRRMPAVTDRGGRGLWMVNQLSDLVQVRSTPAGSRVRMHNWV